MTEPENTHTNSEDEWNKSTQPINVLQLIADQGSGRRSDPSGPPERWRAGGEPRG